MAVTKSLQVGAAQQAVGVSACAACLLASPPAPPHPPVGTLVHSLPRRPQELTLSQFARQVKTAQERYVAGKAAGSEAEMKRGAALLDETQVLFIVGARCSCRLLHSALVLCRCGMPLWHGQSPPGCFHAPACRPAHAHGAESNAVWRTDFTHHEKEPLSVLLNTPAGLEEPFVEVRRGRARGRANRRLDGVP